MVYSLDTTQNQESLFTHLSSYGISSLISITFHLCVLKSFLNIRSSEFVDNRRMRRGEFQYGEIDQTSLGGGGGITFNKTLKNISTSGFIITF